MIILSSFLVVNAATDARFLFLCCCVGDGFIIVVVVLDRLFSFVLLLVLDRVDVAKAIEEEERNIGVAFIPPFTLTCVCVCVCVCVYVCTTEYMKIECWDYSRTNKTEEERYLFFVAFFFLLFCWTSHQCTHYNKRERRRERRRENVK